MQSEINKEIKESNMLEKNSLDDDDYFIRLQSERSGDHQRPKKNLGKINAPP